jgi:ParB/RepB/Spo0J family partition protein
VPEFFELRIEQLLEPELPIREAMDEQKLYDLRDSIRAVGIVQSLLVVRLKPDHPREYPQTAQGSLQAAEDARARFEIVDGHRRYMAARLVPLDVLPCMVFDDRVKAKEAALLAANLYREEVTPMEEAVFFAQIIERGGITEDELSRMLSQTPDFIYGRLKLLKYDEEIQAAIRARKVSLAVAKQINRVSERAHRLYMLDLALRQGMTEENARSMVAQYEQSPCQPPTPGPGEVGSFSYSEPVNEATECIVCGPVKDPNNLRWFAAHAWEKEAIVKLMRAASI